MLALHTTKNTTRCTMSPFIHGFEICMSKTSPISNTTITTIKTVFNELEVLTGVSAGHNYYCLYSAKNVGLLNQLGVGEELERSYWLN